MHRSVSEAVRRFPTRGCSAVRPLAVLSRVSVVVLMVLALLLSPDLASTGAPHAEAVQVTAKESKKTFESKVLRNINRVRTARELHRVRPSDCLDGLAEPWARHLADIGALVHRDQKVLLTRCSLSWAGENLGFGSSLTPRGLVRAWMKSSTHRKILLKPRARRGAVAAASDSGGTTYAVLNLGDPR